MKRYVFTDSLRKFLEISKSILCATIPVLETDTWQLPRRLDLSFQPKGGVSVLVQQVRVRGDHIFRPLSSEEKNIRGKEYTMTPVCAFKNFKWRWDNLYYSSAVLRETALLTYEYCYGVNRAVGFWIGSTKNGEHGTDWASLRQNLLIQLHIHLTGWRAVAGVTADPIPPKIRSGPNQIC